jgi:hypothetical protein
MNQENSQILITEEIILSKIYNRNIGKFPERYMFQLTQDEHDRLRSQNVTLKRGQHIKYLPYAFTEHGILMLSSVLRSQRADQISILIIDTFVKIRELVFLNKDLAHQLEQVQSCPIINVMLNRLYLKKGR